MQGFGGEGGIACSNCSARCNSRTDKVSVPDFSMDKLSILPKFHSSSILLFRCLGVHQKIGGCCAARKHRVGTGYVFIS